ncbi:hypothetical protein [Sorangium sp. So ce1153]|uniref:hypothetical protein n=1 Tax=Sorangium sp. So ce1153 TaxID=3133333 RepID=UPI003F639C5D
MPWSRYPRRVRRRGSLSIALLSAVALTGACANPQGTHGPHAPPVAEAAYGGAQDPHAQQATPPPHAQQATPPPHGPPAEQGPHALRTTPPPERAHGGGGEAGAR